jgi:hypothetical protein
MQDIGLMGLRLDDRRPPPGESKYLQRQDDATAITNAILLGRA